MCSKRDNSPDGTIPSDLVTSLLMPDEEPLLSRTVADMLLPQRGGYMTDPFEGPDARTLDPDATYILGDADRVLARP